MSQPYIGTIMMFAGNFAIRGWQMCNGQQLSIAQNTALFSILGTTYGGNGVSTFALPDMRSRVPLHMGQGVGLSNYVEGQFAGSENATLAYNNMPSHNHLVNASTTTGTKPSPDANIPAASTALASEKLYINTAANTTMSPTMIQSAGGNVPFSILQPYLAVNFLIAMFGIFPSRS